MSTCAIYEYVMFNLLSVYNSTLVKPGNAMACNSTQRMRQRQDAVTATSGLENSRNLTFEVFDYVDRHGRKAPKKKKKTLLAHACTQHYRSYCTCVCVYQVSSCDYVCCMYSDAHFVSIFNLFYTPSYVYTSECIRMLWSPSSIVMPDNWPLYIMIHGIHSNKDNKGSKNLSVFLLILCILNLSNDGKV